MVYPRRWSVSGRTNNDFGERSQALQRLDARSLATVSSPGGNGAFFCIRTTQILVPRPDRLFLSTWTHDIIQRCYQSTAEFLHFICYNIPTSNAICANIPVHKIQKTFRHAFITKLGCNHLNVDNFQHKFSSTFACIPYTELKIIEMTADVTTCKYETADGFLVTKNLPKKLIRSNNN